MWTKKRLLIWGKTYPEFSKSYYETVCTGAMDADTGKLIRIYPITLRYQQEPFKLYDWIEADVMRNMSDFRPESYKINQQSIRVVGHIDTPKGGWSERAEWILHDGNTFQSVEALQAAEAEDHTSLGLVRPKEIVDISVRRKTDEERKEWDEQRKKALAQKDLFVDAETETKELRFIPVEYRVQFTCDDLSCETQHNFSILDWGVYALSRKAFAIGGVAKAERDVIAQIHSVMDPVKNEAYFFLGNTKAHCRSFSVVGFFHPPHNRPARQLSLGI